MPVREDSASHDVHQIVYREFTGKNPIDVTSLVPTGLQGLDGVRFISRRQGDQMPDENQN